MSRLADYRPPLKVHAIDAVHALYSDLNEFDAGYDRVMELIDAPAFYEIETRATVKQQ